MSTYFGKAMEIEMGSLSWKMPSQYSDLMIDALDVVIPEMIKTK
jgi:hypothetical protein